MDYKPTHIRTAKISIKDDEGKMNIISITRLPYEHTIKRIKKPLDLLLWSLVKFLDATLFHSLYALIGIVKMWHLMCLSYFSIFVLIQKNFYQRLGILANHSVYLPLRRRKDAEGNQRRIEEEKDSSNGHQEFLL